MSMGSFRSSPEPLSWLSPCCVELRVERRVCKLLAACGGKKRRHDSAPMLRTDSDAGAEKERPHRWSNGPFGAREGKLPLETGIWLMLIRMRTGLGKAVYVPDCFGALGRARFYDGMCRQCCPLRTKLLDGQQQRV